jgi:DNA-binding transcriptional LysR family regulator
MNLNEIAVFIKVVELGSFSQAAKNLGMPNSTVSSKVSSLEKRLNTTLIQRTTRKLLVTPAGQAYYKRCVQGLEEIRAAEEELAQGRGEPQGLLRITGPVELGNNIFPKLISEYTKKYPKVRVEVILTDRRVDLIAESIDLAIRAGDLKDSTLMAKKVGETKFVLVATPKYLKANGTPAHPRDLLQHQCLQFTPIGIDQWKLVSSKGSFNAPVKGRIIVNDLNTLRNHALLDDGIAFVPNFFIYPEVKAGKLVRVLGDWRSAVAPMHFVYPAQRFVTPKLSAFIAMATETFKQAFANVDL